MWFVGYVLTLVWATSSAMVMLGEHEEGKAKVEQAFQAVGIHPAT